MIKAKFNDNVADGDKAELSMQTNFYTGRSLVSLLRDDSDFSDVKRLFRRDFGLTVAQTSDFNDPGSISEEDYADADVMIYDEIGVALVGIDAERNEVLVNKVPKANYIVEPEEVISSPNPIDQNQVQATWGIDKTNVLNSQYTGRNVKVAVLDTGFDFQHPDFVNRTIYSKSFVPGETADDLNGHGTHCIGTACGNKDQNGVRYGVAKDATIYVGKVLGGTQGQGTDSWILGGITWAVSHNCRVISMSLGAPVYPGQGHKIAYERAARYALQQGTIIVAAAGNESQRPLRVNPIGSPANSPSMFAVAAVDSQLNVAYFSNRAINPNSSIGLSGPGVGVYSSWLSKQQLYHTISGTSMATPHVAGIAALYFEQNPGATPSAIWNMLISNALPLNGPTNDYGAGLVNAP